MFTLFNKLLIYALVVQIAISFSLKTAIPRSQPQDSTTYREYKQFNSSKFRNELKNVITKENIDKFDEQFLKVLNSFKYIENFPESHNEDVFSGKDLL